MRKENQVMISFNFNGKINNCSFHTVKYKSIAWYMAYFYFRYFMLSKKQRNLMDEGIIAENNFKEFSKNIKTFRYWDEDDDV